MVFNRFLSFSVATRASTHEPRKQEKRSQDGGGRRSPHLLRTPAAVHLRGPGAGVSDGVAEAGAETRHQGSGRVQPVRLRGSVAPLRRVLPAAGPPPPEPLPVSQRRLLLGELLRSEAGLGGTGRAGGTGSGPEDPLALSAAAVRGAVPAGPAGGSAGPAARGGRLLHPSGPVADPEDAAGAGGVVPVPELDLADAGLRSAAALRLRAQQDSQSAAVAGPGPAGETGRAGPQGAADQQDQRPDAWQSSPARRSAGVPVSQGRRRLALQLAVPGSLLPAVPGLVVLGREPEHREDPDLPACAAAPPGPAARRPASGPEVPAVQEAAHQRHGARHLGLRLLLPLRPRPREDAAHLSRQRVPLGAHAPDQDLHARALSSMRRSEPVLSVNVFIDDDDTNKQRNITTLHESLEKQK